MSFDDFQPDYNRAEPVSEQIANEIKDQISKGELRPGDQVPTLRALSKKLGVGPVSISKAIQILKQQEILISEGNKGVFVANLTSEEIQVLCEDSFSKRLKEIVILAKKNGYSLERLITLTTELYEEVE